MSRYSQHFTYIKLKHIILTTSIYLIKSQLLEMGRAGMYQLASKVENSCFSQNPTIDKHDITFNTALRLYFTENRKRNN